MGAASALGTGALSVLSAAEWQDARHSTIRIKKLLPNKMDARFSRKFVFISQGLFFKNLVKDIFRQW
jgi:hypothetical protein